ncbi:MAG: hypothetical protein GXO91_05055, partial [FCB group bacterium]|nr:hypothetical protein [FCB group bacterium]
MIKNNTINFASKPSGKQGGHPDPVTGFESPGVAVGKWLTALNTAQATNVNEGYFNFQNILRKMSSSDPLPGAVNKIFSSNISFMNASADLGKPYRNIAGVESKPSSSLIQEPGSLREGAKIGAKTWDEAARYSKNTGKTAFGAGPKQRITDDTAVHNREPSSRERVEVTTPRTAGPSKLTRDSQGKLTATGNAACSRPLGAVSTEMSLTDSRLKGPAKIDVSPLPSTTSAGGEQPHSLRDSALSDKIAPHNPGRVESGSSGVPKPPVTAFETKAPVGSPPGSKESLPTLKNKITGESAKIDVPPLPSKTSAGGEIFPSSKKSSSARKPATPHVHPGTVSVGRNADNSQYRQISPENDASPLKQRERIFIMSEELPARSTRAAGPAIERRYPLSPEEPYVFRATEDRVLKKDLLKNVSPLPKQSSENRKNTLKYRFSTVEQGLKNNVPDARQNFAVFAQYREDPEFIKTISGQAAAKATQAGAFSKPAEPSGYPPNSKTTTRFIHGKNTTDKPAAKSPDKTVDNTRTEPANTAASDISRKIIPDEDNPAGRKLSVFPQVSGGSWETLVVAPL